MHECWNLVHKSGNISETRNDREIFTMEGQRSFQWYHPRTSMHPHYLGFATPPPKPKIPIAVLSQEWVKLYGLQIWPEHSQGPSEQKPIKILEKSKHGHIRGLPKSSRGHIQELLKIFRAHIGRIARSSLR